MFKNSVISQYSKVRNNNVTYANLAIPKTYQNVLLTCFKSNKKNVRAVKFTVFAWLSSLLSGILFSLTPMYPVSVAFLIASCYLAFRISTIDTVIMQHNLLLQRSIVRYHVSELPEPPSRFRRDEVLYQDWLAKRQDLMNASKYEVET